MVSSARVDEMLGSVPQRAQALIISCQPLGWALWVRLPVTNPDGCDDVNHALMTWATCCNNDGTTSCELMREQANL